MIESKEQMLAHELTMSHRRGWKDATASQLKRKEFLDHPREDIRKAYGRGYSLGLKARIDADQEMCKFYGYVPNPLR